MEAIHNYVEALFAVLPQREDVLRVKDDMLANLEEKFRALLEEGRNEEEATGIVIASIGSGEELREQFGTQAPAAASAPAPARRVLPALALLTLVPLVMIAARLCFTSSLLDNAQVWWLIKYTAAGIAVVFALYQLACRQASSPRCPAAPLDPFPRHIAPHRLRAVSVPRHLARPVLGDPARLFSPLLPDRAGAGSRRAPAALRQSLTSPLFCFTIQFSTVKQKRGFPI
ncbi:MAG: permease prefix domain 1-containing protein [Agathobaculum desmolans]|uniref:permease prefix domain 1-containing protein n=1 Tax=Agathobaculum desmolans TaxID=39484 RepID=UPI003994EA7C